MRLGVDFGTTRIVVAAVDRGNYPVISFDNPGGGNSEWFPALIAMRDEQPLFGWEAWQAQDDRAATIVRSIKRYLQDAGPETQVQIGDRSVAMLELLGGLCCRLQTAIREESSLTLPPGEKLEIMLGVPANANGNQRFLTVEAFRRAQFEVLGLLNEPSAASIEYGHGLRGKNTGKGKDCILVYDLGGGTFDASLVEMDENRHSVIASEGIPSLGGYDFDDLLADLALDAAGIPEDQHALLTQSEMFRLHEECRQKKEAIHPNTRRITIELDLVREGWPTVTVPVSDFYDSSQPLITETVNAVSDLLAGQQGEIEALYVTGGASELPLVARALKENFGRRVRRSAYARSATAIGLAIQADEQAGYLLREKFTRNFGVWREAEGGRTIVFDPLFLKGTPLPGPGESPLAVMRRYHAAHNIGHFRYLECSHITDNDRPTGEVTIWDDILFPFQADLRDTSDLTGADIHRVDGWPEVEESYSCDASGAVTVFIANRSAAYERTYRLGRWAQASAPVVPAKKRARRSPPARRK